MRDRPWMEQIVGTPVPSIFMRRSDGREIDLAQAASEPSILYLYPGDSPPADSVARLGSRPSRDGGASEWSGRAEDGTPTPTSCEVQRASFKEYAFDFAAYGVKVIGVSSEPHHAQRSIALAEQLPFPLLSDADCALADALSLPTLADGDVRRYRRMTLICKRGGDIAAVFYPVSPKRSAMQALSWLARESS